jgi:hypothetical protein
MKLHECAHPIELSFFSGNIGRKDLCAHCGEEEAHINVDLKKKWKTVLPICTECELAGKVPIVERPYGRKQKDR